jgi:hypothetical protein
MEVLSEIQMMRHSTASPEKSKPKAAWVASIRDIRR